MEEMWEKGGERMDEGGRKNIKKYIYKQNSFCTFIHMFFPLDEKEKPNGYAKITP